MVDPTTRSFRALGTSAIVVAEADRIDAARAEVERELADIDRTCSRFRADSDLSRANLAEGEWVAVDDLLVTAVEVALRAARITGGLLDPTIGEVMIGLGYDRDFAAIPSGDPDLPLTYRRIPFEGWRLVQVDHERSRMRVLRGLQLDLGSTAKALAADRAAVRAAEAVGGGVLVSLGGDVAVAGDIPPCGWSIGIGDDHAGPGDPGETVSIVSGGLATSSTTVRRWSRGGSVLHHIIDPRTGLPAREVWRTVSVHAATCVDANTASTAAIILGEDAPTWLSRQGLPARLVHRDGRILRVGGWPERAAA